MLQLQQVSTRWLTESLDYFTLAVSKSALNFQTPPAPFIPPNFLFPTPAFTAPPSSSPSPFTEHEDMVRLKRSPKDITWKPRKCELCHLNRQSGHKPRSPVEKEEYFIDNDGTLTIKNGVCPRRLAFRLFMEVSDEHVKYDRLLGENMVKFLLNLKQIVDKHQDVCPDEDSSYSMMANSVLQMYVKASYHLKRAPGSLKRPYELTEKAQSAKEEVSPRAKHAFYSGEENSPDKSMQHSPSFSASRVLSLSQERLQGPEMFSAAYDFSSIDLEGSKGSDKCNSEASSRVASPAPSMSSITSGLSNTKRGTKILPVASTDGQTRYICPVCTLELSNDHELTVHIRSHNQTGLQSTPNTCTICKKTLSSQSSLDRHMLVHSGERPFKCKICGMSFTTNGNMHRHARIHQKNSISITKPQPGRKSSEGKSASKKDNSLFSSGRAYAKSPTQNQFPGLFPEPSKDNVPMMQSNQEFLNYYQRYLLHPAYPFAAMYPDASRHYPYLPMEHLSPDYLMPKRPRLTETIRCPSPDLRSPKTYPCNVCKKVFNNQFSLDSHMEEHVIVDQQLEAEAGATCKTCKTVAKSEQSLLLHYMTHHKKEEDLAEPDTKPGKRSPSSPTLSTPSVSCKDSGNGCGIVGFKDLAFTDFTCRKFPLIAKAFIEDNPEVKGSKHPVFKCNECGKEFPVEGAKDLHEASHVPEEYTKCPKCDCHFTESSRLQEHMLKHVADEKFEQTKPGEDDMPQNHFLAQFGLMAKEESCHASSPIQNVEEDDDNSTEVSASEDKKASMEDDEDEIESLNNSAGCVLMEDKIKRESSPLHSSLNNSLTASHRSSKMMPLLSSSPYNSESERDDVNFLQEGVKPSSFPCEYCDKVLSSLQELKLHESSHKSVSHLQCRVCSYTSTDKSSLLRHMRTHSGERPFKCGLCGYSFTTKANCERHMKQKHNLDKEQQADNLVYNEYVISKSSSPLPPLLKSGSTMPQSMPYHCKVCRAEFQHRQALEQHLQSSPSCKKIFLCILCKSSFKSKTLAFSHMLTNHPEVPSKLQDDYLIVTENPGSFLLSPVLTSPPPAHSKTPIPSPFHSSPLDKLFTPPDEQSRSEVTPARGLFHNKRLHISGRKIITSEEPLDFSKQDAKTVGGHQHTLSESFSEEDQMLDDLPIDLSVQKPSSSSPWEKSLNMRNKSLYSITRQSKEHTDSSKRPTSSGSSTKKSSSDGNNNNLSSMTSSSSLASSSTLLLPFPPPSAKSLSLKLTTEQQNLKQSVFPSLHSSMSLKSALLSFTPSQLVKDMSASSVIGKDKKHGLEIKTGSIQSLIEENKNAGRRDKNKDFDETDDGSEQKAQKGSPSESDSSCELASVNRILDAANAQSFQEYLIIPENEEELDAKSESVSSSDDSNQSLENLYSNSQSFNSGTVQSSRSDDSSNAKQDDSNSEEGTGNDGSLPSVTVNVALIDNTLPKILRDKHFKQNKSNITDDPNNMSKQTIAELIEKVSKEKSDSPAKKKRNSYADSPHKFTCPYCPRCFPWLSSLNRHLLTHTGQKPFRCPRCPVTFSTKSNRERHLIRKHNVNMLDPASRSTMDRPYKCHLCVFSSFSTQSNLIKHYKDRHNGVSPPLKMLEMIEQSLSDGEGEDGQLNGHGASYEDEEEYNSLVEMRGGFSDKDIMLQNYTQDSNSSLGSNALDPHKKRNAIFNLGSDDDQVIGKISPAKSVVTTRPGIDDTVLTETMKEFLDKSVKQAVEDSQRKAIEKGSKFILTPYIERHLRHIPSSEDSGLDLYAREQCPKCDREFLNQKILIKHLKNDHGSDLPYKCHICESPFSSRVECLQHQAQTHQTEWNTLKDKNEIGNVQVFGTRLDKMIEKLCKRGRDILEKQGHNSDAVLIAAKNKRNSGHLKKLDLSSSSKLLQDGNGNKQEINDNHTGNGSVKNSADVSEGGVLEEVITSDYLQRKVYCALCPKRFWSMQDLKRHMRSHTGERPYRCDICFQKFTLKHSMNRHKANHHSEHLNQQDGFSEDDGSGSDGSGKVTSKIIDRPMPTLSPFTCEPKATKDVSANDNSATNDDNNNKNKSDNNDAEDDILHNLLGVEISTIDQIFELKDSAASLLGVIQNSKS